eukprot:1112026-Amorphochlora_amoeboformis.AAC.2
MLGRRWWTRVCTSWMSFYLPLNALRSSNTHKRQDWKVPNPPLNPLIQTVPPLYFTFRLREGVPIVLPETASMRLFGGWQVCVHDVFEAYANRI